VRRRHVALRLGSFEVDRADEALLVVQRRCDGDALWLAFNLGHAALRVPAPHRARATLLSVGSAAMQGAQVHLPPHSAIFLQLDS